MPSSTFYDTLMFATEREHTGKWLNINPKRSCAEGEGETFLWLIILTLTYQSKWMRKWWSRYLLTWNGSTNSRYDFQYSWAWWILKAQLSRQNAIKNRNCYLYIIACNEKREKRLQINDLIKGSVILICLMANDHFNCLGIFLCEWRKRKTW